MLVLTRKKNEELVIGENIVVTVVDIHGGTVRLGINAPKSVTIHRQEVYEKLKANPQNFISRMPVPAVSRLQSLSGVEVYVLDLVQAGSGRMFQLAAFHSITAG